MIITNEPVDCYLIDWFGQKRHNTKNIWFSVRGQTDNYIVKPKGTLQYNDLIRRAAKQRKKWAVRFVVAPDHAS